MSRFICLVLFLIGSAQSQAASENFTIIEKSFLQPVDHDDPLGETFDQQVFVLIPGTTTDASNVFFILGNETDATKDDLSRLYAAYGSPADSIFVLAEHRGYGQSITDGDQSKPSYITTASALDDYERLSKSFKESYSGSLFVAGCSYGGALAINFGYQFPDVADAILATSAPINWPFLIPQYSDQVIKNLGDDLSKRLRNHVVNLTPEKVHDETWQDRELITALIVGLSQTEEAQVFKPYINILSHLPTSIFVPILHKITPEETYEWSRNRARKELDHDLALTGNYNWYTWKYQQCTETGTFFTGPAFDYTKQDHIEDCVKTFGQSPTFFERPSWDVEKMLVDTLTPTTVVLGGRDPWKNVGVKEDHRFPNVSYIYSESGYHCPDVNSEELGASVFQRLKRNSNIQ